MDRVDHPDDHHRLVEPLERVHTDLVEPRVDPALAEPLHEVGREDLARRGERLEPGGLDDRDAVGIVVLEDHLAGTEPDPDLERCDRVAPAAVAGDAPLHRDRRRDRCRTRWRTWP